MTVPTTQNDNTSDRYWFKDYQEVTKKQNNIFSPTHSLCINCADYYDVPPCQTSLNNNGSCFPSLISPDRNEAEFQTKT